MPPTSTISDRLDELQQILENLPDTLPVPEHSAFCFTNYTPDESMVDLIGTREGAINHALEIAFGHEACSKGTLPITERGPGVCSLVHVLRMYRDFCPNPDSDAILSKWINDIREGTQAAYRLAGKEVSINIVPYNPSC